MRFLQTDFLEIITVFNLLRIDEHIHNAKSFEKRVLRKRASVRGTASSRTERADSGKRRQNLRVGRTAMSQTLKKIWNLFSSILVGIVVVLALLLVGARIVGLQVFTVLSGSMEPTYHTGSLIYVKKVDPYTIEEGQPITFMLDENTVATHRVVGIVPDEEDPTVIRFRTKGDANDAEDGSLVHYKNVIGVPIFSIPYLGYLAEYIQHPPGMYVAISAGAILLLLVFIPDIFSDEEKEKDGGKPKAAAKKRGSAKKRPAHGGRFSQPRAVDGETRREPETREGQCVLPDDELTQRLRQETQNLLTDEELAIVRRAAEKGPLSEKQKQAVRDLMARRRAQHAADNASAEL